MKIIKGIDQTRNSKSHFGSNPFSWGLIKMSLLWYSKCTGAIASTFYLNKAFFS